MHDPTVLLQEQIKRAESFIGLTSDSPRYTIWCDTTVRILQDAFTSKYIEMFNNVGPRKLIRSYMVGEAERAFMQRLDKQVQFLREAIAEYKRFHNNPVVDISRSAPLQTYDFHEAIKAVSLKLYEDKHYAQAVEEAFKRVVHEVKGIYQTKTGQVLDGDNLMNKAFGCLNQTPVIAFNQQQSREDQDEQQGMMYLFKGIVGIRNKKAHTNVILNDPVRATEYLSLASLLMRLLDQFTV